jgi:glycine cleavage system T protein (aminomethyltransferase)
MTEFGGWEMPLQYPTGVLAEHRAVREAAGLFDVSHLGSIWCEGAGAAAWLNTIFTNDLAKVSAGQAQYTLLLTPNGGVVDDLIVWLVQEGCWVIPNAANTDAVAVILFGEERGREVEVVDLSHEMAMLALQGPRAREVAKAAGLPFPGRFEVVRVADLDGAVAGTGYTGEQGCELLVPNAQAAALWERLLEAGRPLGLTPCGLGSRDTLRLEMGYPLHGLDMDEGVTPFESGLSWVVALGKERFRGRPALSEEGRVPRCRLTGIEMRDRGVPRHGCPVLADGDTLGVVTSGNFSPTLQRGIALARLEAAAQLDPGAPVEIDIRGTRASGVVTKPPFLKRR